MQLGFNKEINPTEVLGEREQLIHIQACFAASHLIKGTV